MLQIEHISTGYGKKQVLFDISFEVKEGEVILLTGGNGSGKSTVLKCIYRLLPLWDSQGKIFFNGLDLSLKETSKLVYIGITYIAQKNNFFDSMSIQDNLLACGSIYKKNYLRNRLEEIYQLPFLYESRNLKPFSLSNGERQLLAIGIALMHKPRIILLDEPFIGLDNSNSHLISQELIKLKQKNVGILIVEHKQTFKDLFYDKKLNMYLGKLI